MPGAMQASPSSQKTKKMSRNRRSHELVRQGFLSCIGNHQETKNRTANEAVR